MPESFGETEIRAHIAVDQNVTLDPSGVKDLLEETGVDLQPEEGGAAQEQPYRDQQPQVQDQAPEGGGMPAGAEIPDVSQSELITQWAALNERRKLVLKAAKGSQDAQLSLYEDESTRAYALNPKAALPEIDEEIAKVKEQLNIPQAAPDDDSRIDKIADRHADAIGRMALRQGGGMAEGLFGIPGLGGIAGGAMLGGGIGIAAAVMAALGAVTGQAMDWSKEGVSFDTQLAVARARGGEDRESLKNEQLMLLPEGGENLGITPKERLGRANAMQAALGISRREALRRVDAEQILKYGYGTTEQAAAAFMETAAVRPEDMDAGLAASELAMASGEGIGDSGSMILSQESAAVNALSRRTLRPLSGEEAQGIGSFVRGMGEQFGAVGIAQSAELFNMFGSMASSGGGDRKEAFLAQLFAKQGGYRGKRDPQAFMDWQDAYLPTAAGQRALAAFARERYGDMWRMALVELGLAPDTIRAGALGLESHAEPAEVSESDAMKEAVENLNESASGRIMMEEAQAETVKQISDSTGISETKAGAKLFFTNTLPAFRDRAQETLSAPLDWIRHPLNTLGSLGDLAGQSWDSFAGANQAVRQGVMDTAASVYNATKRTLIDITVHDESGGAEANGPPAAGQPAGWRMQQ